MHGVKDWTKQTNQKRTNMDRDMTNTTCRKTDENEAGKLKWFELGDKSDLWMYVAEKKVCCKR